MTGLAADERGSVAVAGAAAGLLACVTAAVVIDGASIALSARRLQAAADLAALAAARDLPRAQSAARVTADANFGPVVGVTTTTGVYRADRDVTPAARFAPAAVADADAVEVAVSGAAPLWFAGRLMGRETVVLTRTGRAAFPKRDPVAMLTLGSRLVRLEGGVANQLLSALTGSQVSLSAVDYDGLARTQVNLLTFTDLLATELGLRAGDYDALLAHEVDAGRLLGVVEQASDGADLALGRLAAAAHGRTIRISELFGLETDAPAALRGALNAEVSVMDLAAAALETGSGDRQLRLTLPVRTGLASLEAWLAIGERPNRSPWLTVDDAGGTTVRTGQARLYLRARTSDSLAALGRVSLPLVVELAPAEARLAEIRCDPDRKVDVDVRPGVAWLRVGEVDVAKLDRFTSELVVGPASLLEVAGVVRITGQADLDVSSRTPTRLRFDDADITAARAKTARSSGLVGAPVARLLERLDLRVQALGVPIGLAGLAQATATLLRPLSGVLDPLVDDILRTAGLSLGEADVTVPQAICDERPATPVLVG